VVQGIQRFRILQVTQYKPFLRAQVELVREEIPAEQEIEIRALAQNALGFFQRVVELSPTLSDELATLAGNIQEPGRLADFVAGTLPTLNTASGRSSSRPSTSGPAWSASTRCWSRTSRCSRSAARSRAR